MGIRWTWICMGWVRTVGVERGGRKTAERIQRSEKSQESQPARAADGTRSYSEYARICGLI